MKFCGIELKSNEARIVSIDYNNGEFEIIEIETKKIILEDPKSQEAVRSFKKSFQVFFETNNFEKIGIKERGRKGKFAGGSDSFKMEGIIQTLDYSVDVLHGNTIKSRIKGKSLKMESLNKYQEEALKVALSLT